MRALVVVNFRVNHTPLVLTGETREMQENGTPAKCSFCYFPNKKGLRFAAPLLLISPVPAKTPETASPAPYRCPPFPDTAQTFYD